MSKSVVVRKRRFEILGQALDRPGQIPVWQFAEIYGVDEITIKRDLTAIRRKGIEIHSVNNEGVVIRGEIEREKLRTLIPEYIGLTYSYTPYHKATDYLLSKIGQSAVRFITVLQRAIEQKEMTYISYSDPEKTYAVIPENIYQNEEQWYLIARDSEISRVLEIAKIIEISHSRKARLLLSEGWPIDTHKPCKILSRPDPHEIEFFASRITQNKLSSVQRYEDFITPVQKSEEEKEEELTAPSEKEDKSEKMNAEPDEMSVKKETSFREAVSGDESYSDKRAFYDFKDKSVLVDDKLDKLIDLKIENMLDYLRGQVEGELEEVIQGVIRKFQGDEEGKKEVSIPLLLDSIKKLLS